MKKGSRQDTRKSSPIIVEPDDEDFSIVPARRRDFFDEMFRGVDFFRDFSKHIENFENFENLEKIPRNGFQEIRSYSSFVEYDNCKVKNKNEKELHVKSDQGKGFIKVIKRSPDGNFENVKDFDFSNTGNKNKIAF